MRRAPHARLADIVDHFAITRHSDDKLRQMQQAVVDELLGMRPDDGFPNVDSARDGTLSLCVLPAPVCTPACDYSILTRADIAGNLWWHIRGALGDGRPSKALIMHEDRAIQESIALAMGQERPTQPRVRSRRRAHQLSAAKLCWIGAGLCGRGMIPHAASWAFCIPCAHCEACASDTIARL